MKEYYYTAEAGSVMLGTDDFKAHYPNGSGNGDFKIYVDKENDVTNPNVNGWNFIDVVEGIFNVYDYDCHGAERLTSLIGRYLIYNRNGDILLKKSQF